MTKIKRNKQKSNLRIIFVVKKLTETAIIDSGEDFKRAFAVSYHLQAIIYAFLFT